MDSTPFNSPVQEAGDMKTEQIPEIKADPESPVEVVSIKFRKAVKAYYFDPAGTSGKTGEFAVVETARGKELGEIVAENHIVKECEVTRPLRPVIRIATPEDMAHDAENREKEAAACEVCRQKIEKLNLEMNLLSAEYTFDNSKLLFYFTADGRVDFRELVKELAYSFRTRIELRQIGIRDEAKMMGGIGVCGRPYCCHSFLPDFAQVTIKMAKEQNFSLNSSKVSGACGRLMCCLRFEHDIYEEEISKTPPVGTRVECAGGTGVVTEINPLARTVRVKLDDKPETPKYYQRSDVKVIDGSFVQIPEDEPEPEPEYESPLLEEVQAGSEEVSEEEGVKTVSVTTKHSSKNRRHRRGRKSSKHT